jgi:hypothetical protein
VSPADWVTFGAVTMKNWLPDAPGGCACVLAIATSPRTYWVFFGGASTTV